MSTFGGKLNPKWDKVKDISLAHKGVFSVFTVIILGIGLFAQRRVDQLVVPVAQMYRFYPGDIHHLHEVPFWHGKELAGPALAYVIGLSVLLVKTRLGDRIKIPRWLSVEYLFYIPLNQGLRRLIRLIGQISATKFPTKFPDVFPQKPFSLGGNPFTMKSVAGTKSAVSDKFQKAASSLHESEKNLEKNFWESFDKTKAEKSANRSHPESMDDAYWSTSNLGFDSLIVALVIALTLLIFLSIGF